jgi:mitochondrial fission protein ELM1
VKVAILSDGKPGHFNQSIGIADIISEDVEVDYKVFDIEPKFKLLIKIYIKIKQKKLSTCLSPLILKILIY